MLPLWGVDETVRSPGKFTYLLYCGWNNESSVKTYKLKVAD